METARADIYSAVTERIIEHLKRGVVPWQKPWTDAGLPQNLISRKPYSGINLWLLAAADYERNLFLTFRQAEELGAKIRKGEKAHKVVFWKWIEADRKESPEAHEPKKIPFLRHYWVFNVSQCSGIPERMIPNIERQDYPIATCEKIIAEMPNAPDIVHHQPTAFYDPNLDYVNMPRVGSFTSREKYYAVLFHELVHSTGHESRLNRDGVSGNHKFGSKDYSLEELIAEMGASYLNSLSGISTDGFEQSAAYIDNWLQVLEHDHRFVVLAGAKAQRAVDYILNLNPR